MKSDKPPTKPGTYLFSGVRRPHHPGNLVSEIERPHVEKVRVFIGGNKRLTYIGDDFLHEPEEAIGAWEEIDTSSVEERGAAILMAQLLQEALEAFKSRSYRGMTLEDFEMYLGKSWSDFYIEDKALRARLVALADAEGLLPQEEGHR